MWIGRRRRTRSGILRPLIRLRRRLQRQLPPILFALVSTPSAAAARLTVWLVLRLGVLIWLGLGFVRLKHFLGLGLFLSLRFRLVIVRFRY